MHNLTLIADYLSANLENQGFILLSQKGGKGLPLVAFRLDPAKGHEFDEFDLAHSLRERGWVVPAYTMAPHSEKLKLMRVVVREDFSRSRADALIHDIQLALETLTKMHPQRIKEHTEHMKQHATNTGKKKNMNQHFTDEDHSLQGKHEKTHAVC
jgi:glutamate decarboxylase